MDAIRNIIQSLKRPETLEFIGLIAQVILMFIGIYALVVIGAILDAVFH